MSDLGPGSSFADHEIVAVAGRGGMGVVYRARHVPLKREVALKVIAPEHSTDPEFRSRFQRECEAAASIQHPNVVTVYHAGEQDGRLYVTMRFVEGTDLAQEIAAHGSLEPERAVALIAQIAQGLDAAHKRGLVHRDVKPANVLIDHSGAALLTDFGVTKNLRSESTHTGTGGFVGTFDYSAPEQFKGERPDARADVYSLGCVLFEALTGSVLYPAAANAAKMFGHVAQPPPPLPASVPEALAAVVTKALAKEPDERFASAGEFGAAAEAALPRGAAPPAGLPPIAPPPALTAESGRGPFVGRTDELKRLRRRLQGAMRGERQFVVIAGEPGIGKSRLVSEFAVAAHADGVSVLYGRSEPESLVPYQPFIAALQQRLALPLAFPAELAPELSELGRFIPALREHAEVGEPVADDPETRRWRLFEAVTRMLAFAARQHPVVLVLDDLEYADPSTALLLAHLVNDPEPVRLLVLGTLREHAEQPAEPLVDLLTRQRRQPSFERIALTGLDATETEALIRAHGGSPAGLARLREQTSGNPFFLEEMLRDGDSEGVPEGVKSLIARRLAALDQTANQVLSAAAVVGREFDLDVLEELVDGDVLSAVEQAEAAGLVREVEGEVDRFQFAHALVRETLYEEQSQSRRVRAHHKIAQALDASGRATPAQLAHHYRESRHLDTEGKAVAYLERAGAAAAAALAYEEAVGHYRHALALREDPELLLALGDAESRAGDPAAARASFLRAAELARATGDGERLARAALGFAGHHATAVLIDREAIALLEEALAALGDSESALVAMLLARLARNPRRTFELSARALDLARASGDTKALVAALESRHAALLHAEYLPQRLEVGEELLTIASARGDRELAALTYHLRIRDLLEAAEFERARADYGALRALAEELRQPLYRHFAVTWEALWLQCEGAVERAAERSREAFELGRRAHVRSAAAIFASQELARRFRGDVTPELVEHIEGLLERNPGLKVWRAMLAQIYVRIGDRERGIEEFERLAGDDFAGVPRDSLWLSTLCLAAEACELLGDRERARVLYELVVPYRDRHVQGGVASSSGSAERFLGLLALTEGDLDRAVAHLEAALAANEAWGLRHVLPVTRYDLARALLATGPDERAQALLRAAVPEAEALGMGPLAASARARLLDPVEHG